MIVALHYALLYSLTILVFVIYLRLEFYFVATNAYIFSSNIYNYTVIIPLFVLMIIFQRFFRVQCFVVLVSLPATYKTKKTIS